MRDPNRIGPTLAMLRAIWEEQPDLRLGQLLCVAARDYSRLFNIEDADLLAELDRRWSKRQVP